MQSVTPPPFPKIKLKELNMHLKCILCGGYYIDATTIIECLHSFCKTCIVKYLETHKFCPICDVQIHKTRPLINIRSDQTLQDIVYKAVPGLFKSEMKRRREFYSKHPDANGMGVPTSSEGRGEVLGGERLIFTPEDYINISLESCPPTITFPPHGNLISTLNDWPGSNRRYFRCPGSLTVAHLKKLLRNKYGLSSHCKIDISYVHDYLDESYTMIDLAYIYSWRRNGDLRLFYQTEQDLLLKRRRIEQVTEPPKAVTINPPSNGPERASACEVSKDSIPTSVPDSKTTTAPSKNPEETLTNGEEPLRRLEESTFSMESNEESADNKEDEKVGNKSSQDEHKEALEPSSENKESPGFINQSKDYRKNSITCKIKDIMAKKTPDHSPASSSQIEIPKSNGSPTVKHNGMIIPEHAQPPSSLVASTKDNKNKSLILATKSVVNFNTPASVPEHLHQMFAANPQAMAHYHQLHQQHQIQLQQQDRLRLSPSKPKSINEQHQQQRNIQPCPSSVSPLNLRVNSPTALSQGVPLHALPHPSIPSVRGLQPKPPRGRKPPQRRRTVKLLQGQIGHTVQQQLHHQQQQKQQQLHAQQQQQQQHFHNLMVHNAQVQQIQQAMLTGQLFSQARLPLGPFRHNEHLNLSIAQNITDNLQQQQRLAAFNQSPESRPSHVLPPPHRLPVELSNHQSPATNMKESNLPNSVGALPTSSVQSSPSSNQTQYNKVVKNSLTPNVTVSFSNSQVPNSPLIPVCLTSTAATTAVSSSNTYANSNNNNNNSNNNNNNNIIVSNSSTLTSTTTSSSNKSEHSPAKSPIKLSRVANYLAKWQPECEPTSPEAYDVPNPLNSASNSNNGGGISADKNVKEKEMVPVCNETLPKSKS